MDHTPILPHPRRRLRPGQVRLARYLSINRLTTPTDPDRPGYHAISDLFGVSDKTMYLALNGKGAYADMPRPSWGAMFRDPELRDGWYPE